VVSEGLRLDVPTIPALVAMKLIAFEGRGRHDPKDLRDLHFIAGVYERCGNESRVFDELGPLLATGELSFEFAGAYLLGLDVAGQVASKTVARSLAVVDRIVAERETLAHVLFGVALDEAAEVARVDQLSGLFSALGDGLRAK